MQNIRQTLGVIFITGIFIISFLFLNASKYDTADRIWLTLLLGISAVAIPLFFGINGIKKNLWLSLPLGLWLLFVWISFIFSHTQNYGFSEAVMLSVAGLFAVTISGISHKKITPLLWTLVGLGIASALYGFWYFPTHGEARMAGLFLDYTDPRHFFPNAFSNFLLMVWPIAFALSWKRARWTRYLVVAILLTALYFTFSRGAWAVFFIQTALIIGIAFFKKQKKQLVIGVLAIGMLAFLFSIVLTNIRRENFKTLSPAQKITFQNSELATSLQERKDFWRGSLSLIKEAPLFGHGPMSFRYVYPRYQKQFLALSDHPHNWLLKIGVENGIPAAIAFTALLIILGFTLFKKAWRGSVLSVFIGISLLGGFLHNLMDYNMNFIPTLFAFFILVGAGVALETAEEEKLKKSSTNEAARASSLALLTLLIIMVTATSVYEGRTLLFAKRNPDFDGLASALLMPRDVLRNTAEELLKTGNAENKKRALALLDAHLKKNPYDARAWYLKGDPLHALELDSMNHFSYYRALRQKTVKLPPWAHEKIEYLLSPLYDDLLAKNIHYTAFSDNPEEAAKLYELFGRPDYAKKIRQKAAEIRKDFAKENDFNKRFGPRAPLNFFIDVAAKNRP